MIDERDELRLLQQAVELSSQCPPSQTAFSVGALVTTADGVVLAEGYSREFGEAWHAEEAALEKRARSKQAAAAAILFSSIEPCSIRKSGRPSCCSRILESGIRRVVFCLSEPPVFVECTGAETLAAHGIAVVQHNDFEARVREINSHLLSSGR